MAIIKVRNPAIDLDAAEIPNLDAAKITSGSFADARIPNLATSKITSGTFADARIAASSVNQHATSFDDNKLVNDISTLALRQSSNENKAAYNTNSMYVDVFQDSTGITNLTNTSRNTNEYVSSITGTPVPTGTELYLKADSVANGTTTLSDHSGNNYAVSFGGGGKHITQNDVPIGSHTNAPTKSTTAFWFDGNSEKIDISHTVIEDGLTFGTGDFTMSCYYRTNNASTESAIMNMGGIGTSTDYNGLSWRYTGSGVMHFCYRQGGSNHVSVNSANLSLANDTWYHLAVTRESGVIKFWKNGVQSGSNHNEAYNINVSGAGDSRAFNIGIASDGTRSFAGRMDAIHIIKGSALYTGSFTPPTVYYGTSASATGSFESNAITASASTNKMGAILTYQNTSGTNTLNTDIILKLSADNGSNYATATMTAMPDFATGIKMAKVNDLSVTAGTQLKYKLEFANQASGSKEARIRGVSLQY